MRYQLLQYSHTYELYYLERDPLVAERHSVRTISITQHQVQGQVQ